jgi:hypothetical protein
LAGPARAFRDTIVVEGRACPSTVIATVGNYPGEAEIFRLAMRATELQGK